MQYVKLLVCCMSLHGALALELLALKLVACMLCTHCHSSVKSSGEEGIDKQVRGREEGQEILDQLLCLFQASSSKQGTGTCSDHGLDLEFMVAVTKQLAHR